ncbi:membrane protein [Paraburkholderia terrae]|uniref:Membrane protein n=1 Tax=Paraburkholderia terrae TaxID=311230 RepID=A0ABM7U164_9BURK|nr:LssY C-terminal domain-containing protein [Paraburkholderia terrae]BCZ85099.1 membrane protein [Paraburkholderia terrae]
MLHAWLTRISEYPYLVMTVVFVTACAESIAVIGTMVPAGIIMFVAGALIGAGVLNGWLTLGVAALGAVIGDSLSYELGRHYHAEVRSWWRAKGHEAVWVRGEQFVMRHGGKSIVLARFFAPVRAVVPLVVGAARMERLRFYPTNVASALAWSPAHIAPGILFGASAALAEAASARLAVALILFAALLWLIVRVLRLMSRFGIPAAKRVVRRAMLEAARRFPRVGGRLQRVIRPDAPAFATLVALALVFIGSLWLFGGALQDVIAKDPLVQADISLYRLLQSLRTAPIDALMASVIALQGRFVGLAMSAAAFMWLALQRSWRTAAWWIAVVGVALVLTPVVGREPNGEWPLNWQPGSPHTSVPDGRAAFNILTYAFLGWILSHRQPPVWRGGVAIAITLLLTMGGLADLYFGQAWLSGLLGGWALGLAWFALLAGTYTYWQVFDEIRPKWMALVVTGAMAVAAAWVIPEVVPPNHTASDNARRLTSFTLDQWIATGWQALPAKRTELGGDEEEPLPVQWAAEGVNVVQKLEAAGWQPAPGWSVRSALGWLLPQTKGDRLPVLPRYSQGERSQLVLIHPDDARTGSRLVLRLWRSHYEVKDVHDTDPLWYGAVYSESLYRPAHLLTIASTRNVTSTSAIVTLLDVHAQSVIRSVMVNNQVRNAVLVFPNDSGGPALDHNSPRR